MVMPNVAPGPKVLSRRPKVWRAARGLPPAGGPDRTFDPVISRAVEAGLEADLRSPRLRLVHCDQVGPDESARAWGPDPGFDPIGSRANETYLA